MPCKHDTVVYTVEENRLKIFTADNTGSCPGNEFVAATGAFFNGDFPADGSIDFSSEIFG